MRSLGVVLSAFVLLIVEISTKPNTRIIGGENARAGDFPFAAAIHVQTPTSKFFCGGSLVGNLWVITSASCVYNATLFTIQLGSLTLTEADSNRVTVTTSEYIVHPDFNPETIQNDIGLIKLRMNLTQSDYLQIANFYVPEFPKEYPLVTIGWGQTSDLVGGESEHLQYVELSSLSNEECKLVYGDQITENMVCAEGNFNEGTCIGDNGGPLLWMNHKYVIVGIASFVSANGCESTNPSGFTRIMNYYSWFSSIIYGS